MDNKCFKQTFDRFIFPFNNIICSLHIKFASPSKHKRTEATLTNRDGHPMVNTKQNKKAREEPGNPNLGSIPYLKLLLEFTVQPSQHCICLLIFADSSLNGLLLFGRLPIEKYKHCGEKSLEVWTLAGQNSDL